MSTEGSIGRERAPRVQALERDGSRVRAPQGAVVARGVHREAGRVLAGLTNRPELVVAGLGTIEPTKAGGKLLPAGNGSGVRLNHRAAWVLKVIASERGLSNAEIAERVGVRGKSHMSRILAALGAQGLVVNMQDDPTPAIPNAWHLTGDGEELERAIHGETPSEAEMRGPRSGPARVALRVAPPRPTGDAEARRTRILSALVRLIASDGPAHVSVERVAALARVPTETFYELFDDRDACVLAAFEQGVERAGARAGQAMRTADGWLETVRAGLRAILQLFDEEPDLARLCLVHSAEAGPLLRAPRRKALAALAAAVDGEREPARGYPPRLTAEAAVNGVLGILQGHLLQQEPQPLVELLNPLMSFIALPYLGARAAHRELARVEELEPSPVSVHAALRLLGNERKRRGQPRAKLVLAALASEPALSNSELAQRSGVADQGQISRLLARLARLGLIENHLRSGDLPVAANAWHLTTSGAAVERAIHAETEPRECSVDGAVYKTRTPRARGAVRLAGRRVRERRRSRKSMHLVPVRPFALPLLR
jgi:AcrR family transcriptional regulator/predicted transcriptional regulator